MSETYHPVIDLTLHGESIFELVLERQNLPFTVGDCVALYDAAGEDSRPYSLASGLHEDVLRIIVRYIEGGRVTSHLASLRPGDTIKMSEPFGWFRPGQDAPEAPVTFIATSTGIAPFLAYLRSYPDRPPRQLLYGVRQFSDAVSLNVLAKAERFQLAVSREEVPGRHFGRVTDLLETLQPVADEHFYLCGLDAMIDEAGQWLESQGVPFSHIHREVFFHAEAPAS